MLQDIELDGEGLSLQLENPKLGKQTVNDSSNSQVPIHQNSPHFVYNYAAEGLLFNKIILDGLYID